MKYISIKKANVHNLKSVSTEIPRNRLTVVTGVSGSGKSSLAFDTLYAEGQRRFVESLSAYARQFLERMSKPDVESITGLPPAIAIGQNAPSRNPRSTVGTSTEIYDYFRLLYARIGISICHKCGQVVRKDNPQSVVEKLTQWDEGSKLYIIFKTNQSQPVEAELGKFKAAGYFRIFNPDNLEVVEFEDITQKTIKKIGNYYILADRLILRKDTDSISRLADSVEAAFGISGGRISVFNQDLNTIKHFSNIFECADCDVVYEEPEPRLFSFNNPKGACPHCQGFGRTTGIDEDLVVPDKRLSLIADAVAPLKSNSFIQFRQEFLMFARNKGIDITKPYISLSEAEQNTLWNGEGKYGGIYGFFKMLEENNYKVQYRILISRYRGFTKCRHCGGSRLRTSARQVFVGGKNIPEIVGLSLGALYEFISNLQLDSYQLAVADQLVKEIHSRLKMLVDIGLHYLTLSRLSHTLSGGESQRINLATALGSSLVGTLYVLDEPSIGLHPRDTDRLINILLKLRNLGNTIVVVEHDTDIIKYADNIIDIGPRAGQYGGEIVYQGDFKGLAKAPNSLTAKYMTGEKIVSGNDSKRKINGGAIVVSDINHNNLKIEKVSFPLHALVVVTGVSGSGKSSLVHDVLYAGLKRVNGGSSLDVGAFGKMQGYEYIKFFEMVDQSSVGASSRSTPATYTKVFDLIRDVFSNTQAAKQLGLKAGYFSFNVAGGRCEECEGDGTVTIDMQFLPDVQLVCESCGGTRYKKEARLIQYKGKNIVEVLDMTVDEAALHFAEFPKIVQKLGILQQVGLGYVKLGQPSSMLSGGESQRVKLATHLESTLGGETLFIFDEPTTGLHLDDISKLLHAIQRLIDKGHSVIIIEHNLHFIAAADWVIDLGPEAGDEGGRIVTEGPPEKIIKSKNSHTAKALRQFIGLEQSMVL